MNEIQKQLTEQKQELEEAIKYAKRILDKAPEGSLLVSGNKNTEQYYWRVDSKDIHGKYIKKDNTKLIQQLAQKEYANKLLPAAKKKLKIIEQFLKRYQANTIKNIYINLLPSKRRLVTPLIVSDEEFTALWEQEKSTLKSNTFAKEHAIYTERGEVVRSKSEKILADKFSIKGIPYHYEKPLYLQGYGNVYPDFTLLNRRTRKEYYWEHFGMMDNEEYCEKTIKKLETMQKNGIFLGDNLIATFETQAHPLNMKSVDSLIEKYLI